MSGSDSKVSPFLVAFLLGVVISWIFTLLGGYEVCDEDPKWGCWEDESYIQLYSISFYPTLFFGFVYFAPKIFRLFVWITGGIFAFIGNVLDDGGGSTINRENVSKKVRESPTSSTSNPCTICGKDNTGGRIVKGVGKTVGNTTVGVFGTLTMITGGMTAPLMLGVGMIGARIAGSAEKYDICAECRAKCHVLFSTQIKLFSLCLHGFLQNTLDSRFVVQYGPRKPHYCKIFVDMGELHAPMYSVLNQIIRSRLYHSI